ncbi:hypothetical protein LSH36_1185g00056 [Paralvinella palmiformis]|uniref:Arrestin C-terminal-like domain-containing protein n=1 Tax=Paralvinella palmiformis TaxID=53620 RepID=A0AAD9IUV6_9ANNE|nr:hypothetical protein LSH36_1185g00056 [Paralvinella palmiformis]
METDFRECSRQLYQANVFRKLDLILQRNDGLEYDENCCLPCLPGCRKPVYESGQVITGCLLKMFDLIAEYCRYQLEDFNVRFSVTFGGRYETSWTEGTLHWGSSRIFFSECTTIIKDRNIELEPKWYRFDFEYQLPQGLPSSVKEPEGKVTYYSFGSVRRLDGLEIGTHDIHFNVQTQLDLDLLPAIFHEPAHRKRLKIYGNNSELSSEQELSGESTDQGSIGLQDPYLVATLCLSSRAFAIGQHVIAEVTVENHLLENILCSVKFEQIFTFEAHAAREYCGRGRPPLYLSQIHTKATRKNVCKPSVVRLASGSIEAYNCLFEIPKLPPSTPERYFLSKAKLARQREPLIRTKYYITLAISTVSADGEDFVMPLEVKIGTCDSMTRETTLTTNSIREDMTSDSAIWDAAPDSEGTIPET